MDSRARSGRKTARSLGRSGQARSAATTSLRARSRVGAGAPRQIRPAMAVAVALTGLIPCVTG
eukprot:4720147-Alexandrium_andersonii.AAC.1